MCGATANFHSISLISVLLLMTVVVAPGVLRGGEWEASHTVGIGTPCGGAGEVPPGQLWECEGAQHSPEGLTPPLMTSKATERERAVPQSTWPLSLAATAWLSVLRPSKSSCGKQVSSFCTLISQPAVSLVVVRAQSPRGAEEG